MRSTMFADCALSVFFVALIVAISFTAKESFEFWASVFSMGCVWMFLAPAIRNRIMAKRVEKATKATAEQK